METYYICYNFCSNGNIKDFQFHPTLLFWLEKKNFNDFPETRGILKQLLRTLQNQGKNFYFTLKNNIILFKKEKINQTKKKVKLKNILNLCFKSVNIHF